MTRFAPLILLLVASLAHAADDKPVVVFPKGPTPLPPSPSAVSKLSGDQLYVFHSDTPCVALASPQSVVRITQETGPIKIRGRFVDGSGVETRTFTAKNVWIVEAVQTGACELLVIPTGATSEKDVFRQVLDVNNGPRPPPIPPDPIPPDPKPPVPPEPPVPVSTFRVLLIYESSATYTTAITSVLYGKAVEEFLDAKCTKDGADRGWRRLDKDDVIAGTSVMATLWSAVKPKVTTVPCVAVERNGKVTIEPFPATPADAVALFKKYLGEK